MRLTFLLLFSIVFTFNVEAKPKPPYLLNYSQLMRLSTLKRADYIQSVVNLLVSMEAMALAQEEKTASLEEIREMKAEFFAMIHLLPKAEAKEDPKKKKRIYDRITEEGESQVQGFHKGTGEEPPAQPATEPAQETCEAPAPTMACTASEEEVDKARKRIGATTDVACIFGGNFSTYENNKVAKGKCQKITSLEVKGLPKPLDCPKHGTYLCNPFLFCAKYKDAKKAKMIPKTCLPLVDSKSKKADLTYRCNASYNDEALAKKGLVKCEPGKSPLLDFDKAWEEMRAKVADQYKQFCLGKPDYKILFCVECQTLGERITAMNNAAGQKCGGTEPMADPARKAGPDVLNSMPGAESVQ